jgi:hypothetical protein
MHLIPASGPAHLDRYIGYWQPYATSHSELDRDHAIELEVENAARTLARDVRRARQIPALAEPKQLQSPRQK